MSDSDHPQKRARLSPGTETTSAPSEIPAAPTPAASTPAQYWSAETTTTAETAVGITEYLTPDLPGFNGILKQRYTDFLVNEIDSDGNVVHLTNLKAPGQEDKPAGEAKPEVVKKKVEEQEKPAGPREPTAEELEKITTLTDAATTAVITALLENDDRSASVTTPEIADKDARTSFHGLIRDLFSSRLLTTTEGNKIVVKRSTAASRAGDKRRSGHRGGKNKANETWQALGGEFLHFSVYKENKDTMEVAGILARLLGLKAGAKAISFAGTKDKRAVTVQRFALQKIRAERLAGLNKGGDRGLRDGIRVGNFEYKEGKLGLGDLKGNEFVITLRGCDGEVAELEKNVKEAVERVRHTGFINYFGLQRFGSSESVSTSDIGVLLLRGEFRTAVEKILSFDPAILEAAKNNEKMNGDDILRAEICRDFFATYDFDTAAKRMPRRFLAENAMLNAMCRRGFKSDAKGKGLDYLGAIQAIPRGLRTMYAHAYQSLVWNNAASARIRMSRDKVLPGDLVIQEKVAKPKVEAKEEVDQDGEIVIAPVVEEKEDAFDRARPLSQEEADSGRWSIRDVVLPTPGWDVVYPENQELFKVYKEVMAKDGLDPEDMRRAVKDWSLPGSYRKIVSGFVDEECVVEVRRCKKGEQVVQTDLEKLVAAEKKEEGGETGEKRKRGEGDEEKKEEETAVVLRMRLGTSCYATMALRELQKGGTRLFRPEFGRPTERT